MRFLHAVAGFVLFFELPIPIYWLILHPFNSFWRSRVRAAFWFAGLTAWTCGGVLLWYFRHALLAATRPSWFAIAAGFALIAVEGYLFVRVERELGSRRLVGHAELTGTGEMFSGGLYAHVRHPRYAGMFCAVLGRRAACRNTVALDRPAALVAVRPACDSPRGKRTIGSIRRRLRSLPQARPGLPAVSHSRAAAKQ